ncbi:MAG: glutamate 5-kinase [Elusimicrobiota bacterium]
MNSFMKSRVVVKIGSVIILDEFHLQEIADKIASFQKTGNEVIIVSSGAIATGNEKLGFKKRPDNLISKQAFASIGQVGLMNKWTNVLLNHNIPVAQILLTKDDFENRDRYLNARNTILQLLSWGIIPVINENDTVATEEINFGDNDTLSALVASKIDANYLIIFTDVDGLYDSDPKKNKNATLITEIKKISADIENYASKKGGGGEVIGSGFSVGGMLSKIKAAKIATASGVETFITNGKKKGGNVCISDIISGRVECTKFLTQVKIDSRKKWIAFGAKNAGKIVIDEGAARALIEKGKSLLPSGIIDVDGDFYKGDAVSIIHKNKEIARGIVFYSAEDIKKIKGHKTQDIEKILSRKDYDEVIHRDNLVVITIETTTEKST